MIGKREKEKRTTELIDRIFPNGPSGTTLQLNDLTRMEFITVWVVEMS